MIILEVQYQGFVQKFWVGRNRHVGVRGIVGERGREGERIVVGKRGENCCWRRMGRIPSMPPLPPLYET